MSLTLNRRAFLGLVTTARSSDRFARGRAYPPGLYEAVSEQTTAAAEVTLDGTSSGDETWTLARWSFPLADGRRGRCAFLVRHDALRPHFRPSRTAPVPGTSETGAEGLLATYRGGFPALPALPPTYEQGSLL